VGGSRTDVGDIIPLSAVEHDGTQPNRNRSVVDIRSTGRYIGSRDLCCLFCSVNGGDLANFKVRGSERHALICVFGCLLSSKTTLSPGLKCKPWVMEPSASVVSPVKVILDGSVLMYQARNCRASFTQACHFGLGSVV
jgi:hypothetical protein